MNAYLSQAGGKFRSFAILLFLFQLRIKAKLGTPMHTCKHKKTFETNCFTAMTNFVVPNQIETLNDILNNLIFAIHPKIIL